MQGELGLRHCGDRRNQHLKHDIGAAIDGQHVMLQVQDEMKEAGMREHEETKQNQPNQYHQKF
jgi:hypothetical protein